MIAGSASIQAQGSRTIIDQRSAAAILTWNRFSVGAGTSVHFNNGSGATLNRVTGNTPSRIDGSLSASGSVYLVNPAGVVVGAQGTVTTGGSFVASTHDTSDAAFLAGGDMTFAGTSDAAVVNRGTITAAQGDVALIARTVGNSGSISAPNGSAALAAGYEVLLRDAAGADGAVVVKVGGSDTAVSNSGSLEGATAELRAEGGNLYALAGNTDAVVRATGTTRDNGRIFLTAGDSGSVTSAATLEATRPAANAATGTRDGGVVSITAGSIDLGGSIDASARGAGGVGGEIVAIAQGHGRATATLSARGGKGGKGGFVETSGHTVDFAGVRVDTSAPGGQSGSWLIDPEDLTVDAASAATIAANLATTDVTLETTATTASGTGVTSTGNGDITIASAIAWNSAHTLTLTAYNDIAINAAITGSNGGLTLDAAGSITTGSGGVVDIGTFSLLSGDWRQQGSSLPDFAANDFSFDEANASFLRVSGGAGTAGNPYKLFDVYGLQGLDSADYLDDSFVLTRSIAASGTANWNGGDGFNPIGDGNTTAYSGVLNGAGYTISGLTIDRAAESYLGLVAYLASGGTIKNLTLSGGSVTGDTAIGALAGISFGEISRVSASAPVTGSRDYVGGLVGFASGGSISHSSSSGAVNGREFVGGLGGYAGAGVAISDSHATGRVTGDTTVGGLVGGTDDTISNSYATGVVSGSGSAAGGLAGAVSSSGTVEDSYATGRVSGVQHVGGLVGYNAGIVQDSHASGRVSGDTYVGGLLGTNGVIARRSYATGNVSATGNHVGGLVGYGAGTITQTYATGTVSGATSVGGLVGTYSGQIVQSFATGAVTATTTIAGGVVGSLLSAGRLTDSYATGAVTGPSRVGGAVGSATSGSFVTNVYATGAVSGTSTVGGLVGENAGSITDSFWNTRTSGKAAAFGSDSASQSATGLTTAQMRQAGTFSAWDIASASGSSAVWRIYEGYTFPLLRSFLTPLTVTATATATYSGTAYSGGYTLTTSVNGATVLGDAGTGVTAINAGRYSLSSGLYSDQFGYDIAQSGTLTIKPASLIVTARDDRMTVDGTAYAGGNGVSYRGWVNGEDASVLGGSLVYGGTAQGASGVGTYTLTAGGLSAGNYAITYRPGTLTIAAASGATPTEPTTPGTPNTDGPEPPTPDPETPTTDTPTTDTPTTDTPATDTPTTATAHTPLLAAPPQARVQAGDGIVLRFAAGDAETGEPARDVEFLPGSFAVREDAASSADGTPGGAALSCAAAASDRAPFPCNGGS